MDIQAFIREYKPVWTEMTALLQQFEKKKSSVQAQQIDRLIMLYKKASAHLAYAQTNYPRDDIRLYLNDLVSKAHHLVYAEQWKSSHRLADFFKRRFIGYVVERKWFIVIATLLFFIGGLSGFISVMIDPLNLYALLPAEISGSVDPSRVGEGHDELMNATVSSYILTNNIRVAVLAFVSGITFGIFTVYLLLFNGLLVGALAAVFWQAGSSYIFWAYILPHGVIELTAIFIAGGAGLYMGYRMFVPGVYSRKYRFERSVKESAMLLLGTVPLFVIAGFIEGYITPSPLSLELKYAFAGATLLLLALYVIYGLANERKLASASSAEAATHEGKAYRASRDFTSR